MPFQGDKELFLIYDREFQAILKSARENDESASNLERLIRSLLPKSLSAWPANRRFLDPDYSARGAIHQFSRIFLNSDS
jgi:hypothetical protein